MIARRDRPNYNAYSLGKADASPGSRRTHQEEHARQSGAAIRGNYATLSGRAGQVQAAVSGQRKTTDLGGYVHLTS